jgi:hypothetical protein
LSLSFNNNNYTSSCEESFDCSGVLSSINGVWAAGVFCKKGKNKEGKKTYFWKYFELK